MDATKVSAGKPKVSGCVYAAPLSSTLSIPTDATTALSNSFKELGYCSEDGVTNSNSPETEEIKAWGGDVVLTPLTGKSDTFSFKLIEALNEEVLKAIYGSGHVTGSLSAGLAIEATSDDSAYMCWVIEVVMTGGVAKRIVLPNAKISEIGDIVYSDSEAIGYEITLAAAPDEDGVTHYEYIK